MDEIFDIEFSDMDGETKTLQTIAKEGTEQWLIVNVASACGLTRQYLELQRLSELNYLTVVGFPCNQFGGQEPGTHEEICQFTSENYSITFPLMAKIEVKGENQHELFSLLTKVIGSDGHVGDIRWNFEKFLVKSNGVIKRYSPQTAPQLLFD